MKQRKKHLDEMQDQKLLHIEEIQTFTLAIAHHDVIGIRQRNILPALQVKELLPWINVYEMLNLAFHFLNGNILVVLGSIGAKLEP